MKTVTPSLRLFYALWPDEAVRSQLAQLLATAQGRLVPPANLHITLAFLGQQPAASVPSLLELAERATLAPMTLLLDRWGYFRRHGVLWVGMSSVPAALLDGRQKLTDMLQAANIAFDAGSRFKPHVTLARDAKEPPAGAQAPLAAPIAWQVTGKVELVSSTVVDRQVRYQVLKP